MKETTKFALKLCLAVLVCPIFLLAALVETYLWQGSQEGRQLSQLQRDIAALPHLANSTFLARHGQVGNFGNGHHTDYWAVELRSITGSRSALKTTYGSLRVPVPNAGEDADDDAYQGVIEGKQPVEWSLLPSPLPPHFHFDRGVGSGGQWDLSRFAGKQGLYTVQVVNSGHGVGY